MAIMRDEPLSDERRAMAVSCYSMVFRLAGRLAAGHDSRRDELIGRGMEGLIRAAQDFDPSRGLKFSTYAHHWIYWVMRNHARKLLAQGTMTTCDPRGLSLEPDRKTVVRAGLDILPPRLSAVLGALGERSRQTIERTVMGEETCADLAAEWDCTRRQVNLMRSKAMDRLKREGRRSCPMSGGNAGVACPPSRRPNSGSRGAIG